MNHCKVSDCCEKSLQHNYLSHLNLLPGKKQTISGVTLTEHDEKTGPDNVIEAKSDRRVKCLKLDNFQFIP